MNWFQNNNSTDGKLLKNDLKFKKIYAHNQIYKYNFWKLKSNNMTILDYIHFEFNTSIQFGRFTSIWKKCKIQPYV